MFLYSIIIPCYNEAKTIKKNVEAVKSYLSILQIEYEIICVNDGSKDNTLDELNNLTGVNIVSYEKNMGKGYCVKQGLKSAKGDYIIMMDADLSTDLSAIKQIIDNNKQYHVIIGSRHLKDSNIAIKQPFKRRMIGRFCRIIVNLMFHFHLKDTQCGFKAFSKEFTLLLINKQKIHRWAFDVEYLYIAKLNKYQIKEIPVKWKDDRTSTVKTGASLSFFKELLKIKRNKKTYYYN